MKIPRLDDLRVFVTAAETSSFTAAASVLNISPVVASAVVKRLERSLGERLFERSTRWVRLSHAGERYLPFAREALNAMAMGEASLHGDEHAQGVIASPLRLALPSDLGRHHIVNWIQNFIAAQAPHPLPQIDLRISDRVSNLLQEQVEFAIRYGAPSDSDLIAFPLAPDNRRVLCAAPAYLRVHGMPQHITDLKNHNCLRFALNDVLYSRWRFEVSGKVSSIEVHGQHVADDAAVVRHWAVAGLGIAYKSQLDIACNLEDGSLVQLLTHIQGEPTPLWFYSVSKAQLSTGIRRLVAHLETHCRAMAESAPVITINLNPAVTPSH